ncbi:hypothetical protein THUN1379_19760 [Paludibacterium sp. THUN1379]|uniref:MFS transporter n=1 Tax=Paludibacterium sp. THUN1379 TaxID=3112107 RepID=UPI0030917791|nr:hypothetical protein THUN1379_19760 [Paludibacterium sp. THUN1379]
MFRIFLRAWRHHAWLRRLCFALIASSIGNGLTFIVIFATLRQWHAPPSGMALAFVLNTAPGLLGSRLGESLLGRMSPARILMLAEAGGLAGLLLPWLALALQHPGWLLLASLMSALTGGMALPALTTLLKQGLAAEETAAGALIDTLVFACHVLFGIGLGVLLYPHWPARSLLALDALSYLLAIAWLNALPVITRPAPTPSGRQRHPTTLTAGQRRSLWLLSVLTLVGAPAMALLPVLGSQGNQQMLPLLFARSLGQLCGPLLVREHWLSKGASNRLLLLCLAGFALCYGLLPVVSQLPWALLLVFLAHVLSNVVFSLGWHGLLRHFPPQLIGWASACSYRRQVWTAACMGMAAGWLADMLRPAVSLYLSSALGLLMATILLLRLPGPMMQANTERSGKV